MSARMLEAALLGRVGAYVGGQAMLMLNLRDAVALARRAEVE